MIICKNPLGAELDSTDVQIVELIALGRSNRQIAATVHLSYQTIRNRVTRIFDATGAGNRTQLAVMWLVALD